MLLLRKILFLLCSCYFWKAAELTVVEYANFSFTYGRNSTQVEHKVPHKPLFARRISHAIATPKCTHEYYCERADGYPAQELLPILHAHNDLKNFFGVDKEPIENRMDNPKDTYLCATTETVIFPQTLKDQNNNWKYVVNQPGGFQQGIRIETCIKQQTGCKFVDPPFGYTTTCKQKFSHRKLLSVSSTGELEGYVFSLPMACCCSYTVNRS